MRAKASPFLPAFPEKFSALKEFIKVPLRDDTPGALVRVEMVGGGVLFVATGATVGTEHRVLIRQSSVRVDVVIAHMFEEEGEKLKESA
jgi:hypothetical protein